MPIETLHEKLSLFQTFNDVSGYLENLIQTEFVHCEHLTKTATMRAELKDLTESLEKPSFPCDVSDPTADKKEQREMILERFKKMEQSDENTPKAVNSIAAVVGICLENNNIDILKQFVKALIDITEESLSTDLFNKYDDFYIHPANHLIIKKITRMEPMVIQEDTSYQIMDLNENRSFKVIPWSDGNKTIIDKIAPLTKKNLKTYRQAFNM